MAQPARIYRSLNRPHHFLGGERLPGLVVLGFTAVLVVAILSLASVVIGFSVWVISFAMLRRMFKADPHMTSIYLRYLRYRKFYDAKGSVLRKSL